MDARRRIAAFTVAIASFAALALPGVARAGGGLIPEMGTRKTAMGAMVGRPDELAAIYHNPAGLTMTPGTNLYVNAGIGLVSTDLRLRPWSGSGNYINAPVDSDGYYPRTEPSRAFGVVPMLVASTNLFSEKIAVAAGFYLPNAVGAAFDAGSVTRYHLIDSYAVTGAATVAIAYHPIRSLHVGVGVSLLYMRLFGLRKLFPVLHGTDLSGLLGSQSELELHGEGFSAGVTLGVVWRPIRALSFGAAVISRSDFTLEGDVEVRLGKDAAARGKSLSGTQRTDYMLPWTVQLGVNWDVTRWLELGGEFRIWLYDGQLEEQRTEIDGIDVVRELVTPKDYKNSWHVSGGAKVTLPPLPALELMAGFHYDRSPAPDANVSMEAPTFTHVGFHSGLRYRFNSTLRMAATYVHYRYLQRSTDESSGTPPSNFVGSGSNNIFTLIVELCFGRGLGV
ncbi:MAG: outer membrane protein transport protein [Myxococcales bacterium]|nr:outer membrane protein transport protein [Myxococcales bacterium]